MTTKRVKISREEMQASLKPFIGHFRTQHLPDFIELDGELLPDPEDPCYHQSYIRMGGKFLCSECGKHIGNELPDPVAEGECCVKCLGAAYVLGRYNNPYCSKELNCPCHTPKEETANCMACTSERNGIKHQFAHTCLPPIEAIGELELQYSIDTYDVARKLNELIRAMNRLTKQ